MKKQSFERALEIKSRLEILEKMEKSLANGDAYILCGEFSISNIHTLNEEMRHAVFKEVMKEKEALENEFEKL